MTALVNVLAWLFAAGAGALWSAARAAERDHTRQTDDQVAAQLLQCNGLGMALRLNSSPLRSLIHTLAPEGDQ